MLPKIKERQGKWHQSIGLSSHWYISRAVPGSWPRDNVLHNRADTATMCYNGIMSGNNNPEIKADPTFHQDMEEKLIMTWNLPGYRLAWWCQGGKGQLLDQCNLGVIWSMWTLEPPNTDMDGRWMLHQPWWTQWPSCVPQSSPIKHIHYEGGRWVRPIKLPWVAAPLGAPREGYVTSAYQGDFSGAL